MTEQSLHTLVTQAQAGDREAYSTIVLRFQDMAVGYGYALLGDFHQAEDAAQEAFIGAYRDLAQLRDPAAFPGWFRTIVFKHCHRLMRGRRIATVPLDRALERAALGPGPHEDAEQREQREQVCAAISALPSHQRAVITLFYINDHSCAEIAQFLGIPIATVKTRLHAARKQLHERMLTVIGENLAEGRPSRDQRFAERVLQFFAASATGDTATVGTLLHIEPNLIATTSASQNVRYDIAIPPLIVAVMHNQRDVIDLLLAQGADINAKDSDGISAIYHAIDLSFLPDYDWRGMVDFLVVRGATIADIFAVLWIGDHERLRAFVAQHPESVNRRGPGGATPLCFVGRVEDARLLIDNGADLHATISSDGGLTTPLRFVARFPETGVFRYYLQQLGVDSDPFFACVLGDTADAIAAIRANPGLIHQTTGGDHLLWPGMLLLHLAAQYGRADVVTALLDAGANVNAMCQAFPAGETNIGPLTPLQIAAWRAETATVRLLLAHGADPNIRDSTRNLTSLEWAAAEHADWIDRSGVIALLRGTL